MSFNKSKRNSCALTSGTTFAEDVPVAKSFLCWALMSGGESCRASPAHTLLICRCHGLKNRHLSECTVSDICTTSVCFGIRTFDYKTMKGPIPGLKQGLYLIQVSKYSSTAHFVPIHLFSYTKLHSLPRRTGGIPLTKHLYQPLYL